MYSDSHKIRIAIAFTLLSGLCLTLGVRLFYLQIIEYKFYRAKAKRVHSSIVQLLPRRGLITDRKGHQLAVTVEQYSLFANKKVDNARTVAKQLSKILDENSNELYKKLSSAKGFIWLKRQVSREVCNEVIALNIKNISYLEEPKRFYPKKELASNLIGFTGLDNDGLEGIEYAFNKYIKGEGQRFLGKRDAKGRSILPSDYIFATSSMGADITLTIDENIQHLCEKELAWAIKEFDALSGQVVVLNPENGEVLAMAVRPTFNPNAYQHFQTSDYRNRTITDMYEPGSSFKIVTAAAALEEGIVAPDELVDCGQGYMVLGNHVIDDFKAHGKISFQRVVEVSSNVGIVRVALILGEKKIYEYAKRFGFGEKTNISLSGESKGILREPKDWSGVSLGAVPIGQEVAVTTLQMAVAISVIANGGQLVRPYVVKEIIDADGTPIRHYKSRVMRKVISKETVALLKKFLEGAVVDGTGHSARVPGYRVAGKTGTAQKVDPEKGGYFKDKYIMTFVGFAPVENPQIAVAICLDSPSLKGWAANTAAPLFARITKQVMAYLEVPIDTSMEQGMALESNDLLKTASVHLATDEKDRDDISSGDNFVMPDLIGLSMREAFRRLQPMELEVEFLGSGVACEQIPAAGTEIVPGSTSTVKFSNS